MNILRKALRSVDKLVITNAKVELANGNEAIRVLEYILSDDRSLRPSDKKDHNNAQAQLATASVKLQIAVKALAMAFK